MSPAYEVTAVWIERYSATLRVEADSEETAREMGKDIWRDRPLDFLGNAEFTAARLLGFEAEPWVDLRASRRAQGAPCPQGRP